MVSILTPGYAQYFGFTPAETEAMLDYYEIKSNFESGEGRSDLMLIPLDELQPAIIMEFKHVKRFSEIPHYSPNCSFKKYASSMVFFQPYFFRSTDHILPFQ